MYYAVLQEKRLRLNYNLPPLALYVVGDHVRLRQIVINILQNAIKFTEEGGKIDVTLRRGSGKPMGEMYPFAVDIQDDGMGMTPDHMSKLFTPYLQADKSIHGKFGGTGLGTFVHHIHTIR